MTDATDPLKNYKFTVTIVPRSGSGEPFEIGLMSVSGLGFFPRGGRLVLSRAVVAGKDEFFTWIVHRNKATVLISVDDDLTFTAKDADPISLHYSDLDAGSNELLVEQLELLYDYMAPAFS